MGKSAEILWLGIRGHGPRRRGARASVPLRRRSAGRRASPRPAAAGRRHRPRAPRVSAPAALAGILTQEPYERLLHTYGKSYPETIRAFARDFANAPDLVALPANEADVAAVLDWASGAKVAVIPFGGGSSVVGGVEPASATAMRARSVSTCAA